MTKNRNCLKFDTADDASGLDACFQSKIQDYLKSLTFEITFDFHRFPFFSYLKKTVSCGAKINRGRMKTMTFRWNWCVEAYFHVLTNN